MRKGWGLSGVCVCVCVWGGGGGMGGKGRGQREWELKSIKMLLKQAPSSIS